tara:strand:+ start:87 stop:542 length:456 start_codon:yes stop_codon:yes gene_type:complete
VPHSKRLNPLTVKLFKHGFVRKDGMIFDGYQTSVLRHKTGFCKEIWRTPEGYKESLRYDKRRKKFLKSQFDNIINKIKTGSGCAHCGNHFKNNPQVLDFHHIDPKTKNVSHFWRTSYSQFNKILKEIKKCIVLCANCHRIEHNGSLDATKN